MANAKKGEVSALLDGKLISLSLTFNGMCEIEDHFGEPIVALLTRMQDGTKLSFREVRAFLHVVLRQKLPDATVEDAGRLIEESGLEIMGDLIDRCRVLSEGDPETDKPEKPTPARVTAQ